MTTTLEPPPRASRLARARRDFRRWRRARPFWGGFFLILAGLELLWSSNLSLGDLEIHFGLEGFLSYLLPALLILTGLFVWLTPKQRIFYALLGTLTAVYSLIGLNLGGFLLGMLFGIVGGSLSFAWTPVKHVPPRVDPVEEPADDTDPGAYQPDSGVYAAGDDADEGRGRLLASIAVPLLLTAVVAVGVGQHPGRAMAEPCAPASTSSGDVVNGLTDLLFSAPTQPPPQAQLAADATPTPTESSPAEPTPSEPPASGPPSDPPTPEPSTTDPPPTAEPTATPGPCTGSGPGSGGSGGGTTPRPRPRAVAAPPGQPIVSSHPGKMTADLLSLVGFGYDGVYELPTAGGGTIRALRFHMETATSDKFQLLISAGGHTQSLTSDPLVVSGSVAFYTSRFTGTLVGTPFTFTFTADEPPLIPIPAQAAFSQVSLDLVYVGSDTLTATKFAQAWLA